MNKKLLIIYYHEVVPDGQGYSYQKIEIDKFENQMRFLRDKGYKTLFFSELDRELPDKALIVSFDDGFRTVYENAAPIMQKYNIKGNVYLPTSYIGNDDHFMNWKMVKELTENKQFEMQAHTNTHVDIRTLNENSLRKEISESDKIFLDQLGYKPNTFCMPFGTFDHSSIKLLQSQNRYNYILGSFYGRIHESKLKSCILPRIGISNDDSMKVFEDKLLGKYDWKGPLQIVRLQLHNLKKDRILKYEY